MILAKIKMNLTYSITYIKINYYNSKHGNF